MKSRRALKTALTRVGAVALSGTAVRLVDERWSGPEAVVSGEGARLHGGRYNPPGSFRAVYLTENALTGLREVTYPLSAGGRFSVPGARRMVVVPVAFRLTRVLDLCDFRVRIALGTDRDELLQPVGLWEVRGERAPTQVLGEVVYRAGWSGIKFPSRHDPDTCNLVVFPENLAPDECLCPRAPEDA